MPFTEEVGATYEDWHWSRWNHTGDFSVELSLSERGKSAIAETFAAHNQREHLWAQALSREEQRTMFVLLGKIMERRSTEDVRRRS
jgi:hypothetical protein